MNVSDAVSAAKAYVKEAFAADQIINLGLEEIEYDPDDETWSVTVGFSRPWDKPRRSIYSSTRLFDDEESPMPLHRDYRVVRIADDGKIISVRLRDIAA